MKILYNKELIEKQVEDFVFENISETFEFRDYQKEAIIDIIFKCLNDEDNPCQVIEAPTGSGKSLMNIISAGVLAKYYERASYILCSDLYLWKQYDDFIRKYPKIHKLIATLKGQTGNYKCTVNGEDMRNAECRMANINWGNLFEKSSADSLGFSCAKTCRYVN